MNLQELNDQIWERHAPSGPRSYGHVIEKDNSHLTSAQWDEIKSQIEAEKLIVTPGTGTFGFSHSITIWKPAPPIPYPGTEDACTPEPLLCLTAHHLSKVLGVDYGPDLSNKFWTEVIETLAYTAENQTRLGDSRMDPLGTRADYSY